MDNKTIFRLNDDISFRKCSLFYGEELTFGNCTNFSTLERNWKTYFNCNQDGIHFHCTTHPEIELELKDTRYGNDIFIVPNVVKTLKSIIVSSLKIVA